MFQSISRTIVSSSRLHQLNKCPTGPSFHRTWIRSASKIPPGIIGKRKQALAPNFFKPRIPWTTGSHTRPSISDRTRLTGFTFRRYRSVSEFRSEQNLQAGIGKFWRVENVKRENRVRLDRSVGFVFQRRRTRPTSFHARIRHSSNEKARLDRLDKKSNRPNTFRLKSKSFTRIISSKLFNVILSTNLRTKFSVSRTRRTSELVRTFSTYFSRQIDGPNPNAHEIRRHRSSSESIDSIRLFAHENLRLTVEKFSSTNRRQFTEDSKLFVEQTHGSRLRCLSVAEKPAEDRTRGRKPVFESSWLRRSRSRTNETSGRSSKSRPREEKSAEETFRRRERKVSPRENENDRRNSLRIRTSAEWNRKSQRNPPAKNENDRRMNFSRREISFRRLFLFKTKRKRKRSDESGLFSSFLILKSETKEKSFDLFVFDADSTRSVVCFERKTRLLNPNNCRRTFSPIRETREHSFLSLRPSVPFQSSSVLFFLLRAFCRTSTDEKFKILPRPCRRFYWKLKSHFSVLRLETIFSLLTKQRNSSEFVASPTDFAFSYRAEIKETFSLMLSESPLWLDEVNFYLKNVETVGRSFADES